MLIMDNMVVYIIKIKGINGIIVGVDCIVVNGDMVNKIGIYGFVFLVKVFGILFYVVVLQFIFDLFI